MDKHMQSAFAPKDLPKSSSLPSVGTIWQDNHHELHTVFGIATCEKSGGLLVLHMLGGQPEMRATEFPVFQGNYQRTK